MMTATASSAASASKRQSSKNSWSGFCPLWFTQSAPPAYLTIKAPRLQSFHCETLTPELLPGVLNLCTAADLRELHLAVECDDYAEDTSSTPPSVLELLQGAFSRPIWPLLETVEIHSDLLSAVDVLSMLCQVKRPLRVIVLSCSGLAAKSHMVCEFLAKNPLLQQLRISHQGAYPYDPHASQAAVACTRFTASSLEKLELMRCDDTLFTSGCFPALTALELFGQFVKLSSVGIVLSACPALLSLDLEGVRLADCSPPKHARKITSLRLGRLGHLSDDTQTLMSFFFRFPIATASGNRQAS